LILVSGLHTVITAVVVAKHFGTFLSVPVVFHILVVEFFNQVSAAEMKQKYDMFHTKLESCHKLIRQERSVCS